MINVTINGEEHQFLSPINLAELLQYLNLPLTRIAVELNQAVVSRAHWSDTEIKDNDKLEVVHFVGGGNSAFRL
jgi:thiamine biosynthesis protein ThiS